MAPRVPKPALTRREAAHFLNVPSNTVKLWILRGWIGADGERKRLTVAGHNKQGHPMYPTAELRQAEKDTRNNPNSRRHLYAGSPPRLAVA